MKDKWINEDKPLGQKEYDELLKAKEYHEILKALWPHNIYPLPEGLRFKEET